MGQRRQSVRIRQQEEEEEEGFKVIYNEEQGWLRKVVGISCSKQPKNTVQMFTAMGPEAKAGAWLREGGQMWQERERRGRGTRASQTS